MSNSKIVYKLGLLHFIYLVMKMDGEIDFREVKYFEEILKDEEISEELLMDFKDLINKLDEQAIFDRGIKLISLCSKTERTSAFSILSKMTEADAKIEEIEVRFLANAYNEISKVLTKSTSQNEASEIKIYIVDRNGIDLKNSEKVFSNYFNKTSIESHFEIELAIENIKKNQNRRSLLFLAIDLNSASNVDFFTLKLHLEINVPLYALIAPNSFSPENFNSLLICPAFRGFFVKPLKRNDMVKIGQENNLPLN